MHKQLNIFLCIPNTIFVNEKTVREMTRLTLAGQGHIRHTCCARRSNDDTAPRASVQLWK